MDFKNLLSIAKNAAKSASIEILKIYESGDFSIESKSDNSPLTLADKSAHLAIVNELEQTGLPILSEEGKEIPYEARKNWEYFWMIDPLDGTKEFIKRNGEFTVNIALIHKQSAILGVVMVPVSGDLYEACSGYGAWKNGIRIQSSDFSMDQEGLRVVASRSHNTPETEEFIHRLQNPTIVSKGSSLKLLMVAEGIADLYPRYAPTMEWDTAASQIIVEEGGGKVLIKDTPNSMTYNKPNLLNPFFLVTGKSQNPTPNTQQSIPKT